MRNQIRTEKVNKRTPLETVVPLDSPYIVNLDPSGACNFRCVFCPCNTSKEMTAQRHHIMEWELFVKIVADLEEFQGGVKVINLYAFGEPLLNPRLIDMITFLKERGVAREVRIVTNGSLLTEEMSKGLVLSGLDHIRISVEALDAAGYADLCKINFDPETLKKNIRFLYDIKTRLNSEMIVSVKTVRAAIHSLKEEAAFLDDYSPISDVTFIEDIGDIWSEFDGAQGTESALHSREKYCAYPLTTMVIHSNGLISACCVDWKFQTVYGDVNLDTLYDIWHSDKLRQLQYQLVTGEGRKNRSFCNHCSYICTDYIDDVAPAIAKRLSDENKHK